MWKTIESAPKDGTEFFAWTEGDEFLPFVYWDKGELPHGWASRCFDWSGKITHWDDLPEPPEGEKG